MPVLKALKVRKWRMARSEGPEGTTRERAEGVVAVCSVSVRSEARSADRPGPTATRASPATEGQPSDGSSLSLPALIPAQPQTEGHLSVL